MAVAGSGVDVAVVEGSLSSWSCDLDLAFLLAVAVDHAAQRLFTCMGIAPLAACVFELALLASHFVDLLGDDVVDALDELAAVEQGAHGDTARCLGIFLAVTPQFRQLRLGLGHALLLLGQLLHGRLLAVMGQVGRRLQAIGA
jgi:hypothetical protein